MAGMVGCRGSCSGEVVGHEWHPRHLYLAGFLRTVWFVQYRQHQLGQTLVEPMLLAPARYRVSNVSGNPPIGPADSNVAAH